MAIRGRVHVNKCLIYIGAMAAVMSLVPELVHGIPQSPAPSDAPSTDTSMMGAGNTTTVKSDTASSAPSMVTASGQSAATTSKSATPNSMSSPTTTTTNPMKATSPKGSTEAPYFQPTPATSAPWSIFGRPPQKPNIEIKWVPLGTLLFNKFKNHHLNRNKNPLSNLIQG